MSKAKGRMSLLFLEVLTDLPTHLTLPTNIHSIRSSWRPRGPGLPLTGKTTSADLSVTFHILDHAAFLKSFHALVSEMGFSLLPGLLFLWIISLTSGLCFSSAPLNFGVHASLLTLPGEWPHHPPLAYPSCPRHTLSSRGTLARFSIFTGSWQLSQGWCEWGQRRAANSDLTWVQCDTSYDHNHNS